MNRKETLAVMDDAARIAELEAEVTSVRNWATNVTNELAGAYAERDRLKAALKPFAVYKPSAEATDNTLVRMLHSVREIRAALAALSGEGVTK